MLMAVFSKKINGHMRLGYCDIRFINSSQCVNCEVGLSIRVSRFFGVKGLKGMLRMRRFSILLLLGIISLLVAIEFACEALTKIAPGQTFQIGSAPMRNHPPKYIGIISPLHWDGMPESMIPIDLQQAMESTTLVTKDHLRVVLLDTPQAISSALTIHASDYLAIINPPGEFYIVKDKSDVVPMLSRIRRYVERGGSWWATGGYPFYYAAWMGGMEGGVNGWEHEAIGVKGLAALGLSLNRVPESDPAPLKITPLGTNILGVKWAKFTHNEHADADRAPDWKTAGAVLVQVENRPYVTVNRIGKGLMWHICGTTNSASVTVPCIIGSCEYVFNHSIPEKAFTSHSKVPHDRVMHLVSNGKTHQIRELPDLEYARVGNTSLKLDLYLPEKVKGRVPVIVWVHGGGWVVGDRKNPPGLELVRKGYALASVEYRLSPEAIFPAQLYDIKAAIRWLRAHARQYGLNSNRFGAWGHSAGGHLVAILGTTDHVKLLEGNEGGNLVYSSSVQCVSDWAGPTDFLTDPYEIGSNSAASKLIGATVKNKKQMAKRASPVTYVSSTDPPFLIVHGEMDRIVPAGQAKELYVKLRRAGVQATLMLRPFTGHDVKDPMVMWAQERFFDKYLKPHVSRR